MIADNRVEPLAEEIVIIARGPNYRLADVGYQIVAGAPSAMECCDCGRLFVRTPTEQIGLFTNPSPQL